MQEDALVDKFGHAVADSNEKDEALYGIACARMLAAAAAALTLPI
jgi:hypothetical protein